MPSKLTLRQKSLTGARDDIAVERSSVLNERRRRLPGAVCGLGSEVRGYGWMRKNTPKRSAWKSPRPGPCAQAAGIPQDQTPVSAYSSVIHSADSP